MKYLKLSLICLITLVSCNKKESTKEVSIDIATIKNDINASLNNWHKAAANADFETYFNLMTNDGVFLGTDATENWQLEEFKSFSKPYFDKGKAWSFTALERNIYVYDNQNIAWFDELLDTQMEICRGSGVIEKVDDTWKVKHYVLSIAIPNDNVPEVVSLKKKTDSILKLKMIKR